MLPSLSSFYNTYQTRILSFAVFFALVTNIATIMILFEQLEHESFCEQQKEFNYFVQNNKHHHQLLQGINQHIQQPKQPKQSPSNNKYIIPKPNKLRTPPIKLKTSDTNTQTITINDHEFKANKKKKNNTKNTNDPSILDARGGTYTIFEYETSEIKDKDWKYYLDFDIAQISYSSKQCNDKNYASSIFMNALSKWISIRENGWFTQYDCPLYMQTEYRPIDLIPHIYQTQCAPFWPSDIVYLLSEILMPSMLSIQYGFSLSSIWLANFVDTIKIIDNRKDKINEYKQYLSMNKYDLSNIEMEYQRMSKNYVRIIDPNKGRIVDFVVIEYVPEYHDDVIKYIVSVIKENNGILLIKLSDHNIPKNIKQIIDDLIPKYWLRYDAFIPKFLVHSVPFSQEQYLEEYNMTIWITRTKNHPCDVLTSDGA